MERNKLIVSFSFSELASLTSSVYCVPILFALVTIAPIVPSTYCFVCSRRVLIDVFGMKLYSWNIGEIFSILVC